MHCRVYVLICLLPWVGGIKITFLVFLNEKVVVVPAIVVVVAFFLRGIVLSILPNKNVALAKHRQQFICLYKRKKKTVFSSYYLLWEFPFNITLFHPQLVSHHISGSSWPAGCTVWPMKQIPNISSSLLQNFLAAFLLSKHKKCVCL